MSSSVAALVRRRPRKSAGAWRTLTTFPSSFARGHLLSSVRPPAWERAPRQTDGPTKTCVPPTAREGWRHPESQGAFHRCDDGHVKGSLLSVSRIGLSLTPPTRSPHGWGQHALDGHCKRPREGEPRTNVSFELERTGRLCYPLGILSNPSRLGLTTQARQRGSICAAFRES